MDKSHASHVNRKNSTTSTRGQRLAPQSGGKTSGGKGGFWGTLGG